jgi:hypothetical protein
MIGSVSSRFLRRTERTSITRAMHAPATPKGHNHPRDRGTRAALPAGADTRSAPPIRSGARNPELAPRAARSEAEDDATALTRSGACRANDRVPVASWGRRACARTPDGQLTAGIASTVAGAVRLDRTVDSRVPSAGAPSGVACVAASAGRPALSGATGSTRAAVSPAAGADTSAGGAGSSAAAGASTGRAGTERGGNRLSGST